MHRVTSVRAGLCVLGWIVMAAPAWAQADKDIALSVVGVYESGIFNADGLVGSEVAAYDKGTKRLFITNVADNAIDIVSIADPAAPSKVGVFDLSAWGASPNSVAAHGGLIAVAVQADPKTDPGLVVFFRATGANANGAFVAAVTVGALPDMLTFTPDGKRVLVANEGEPNHYPHPDVPEPSVDPVGSVSIIDVSKGSGSITQADVITAGFEAFSLSGLDPDIRIFGPGATVAQDLEPEYISVSDDSRTAWVTLQENNAIAEIDILNGVVLRLMGLGLKDHRLAGNRLDGSDEDDPATGNDPFFNLANWPVLGMYMPDGMASYRVRGQTYLVTANEGDAREYIVEVGGEEIDTFVEEARVKSLTLNTSVLSNDLKNDRQIGRLTVTIAGADTNPNVEGVERLLAFGARSFSIWTTDGVQVFDSGDAFEVITREALGDDFNSTNDANDSFDNRSDNKGPEPEGVAVQHLWGRWYAFIALERVGGVMVYDVTDPAAARFVQYVNRRDFSVDFDVDNPDPAVLDLGPETLFVIPASDSPSGEPLLVVCNEVSGTTTLFQISKAQ